VSQSNGVIDLAEQARAAASVLGSALFNPGTEVLLKSEAEFLASAESTMVEWLHRRREAVLDAQRLFVRMRECRDLTDLFNAQQDWVAGAFDRLAADAESYGKTALSLARSMEEAGRNGTAPSA